MQTTLSTGSPEQDWRLKAKLEVVKPRGVLDEIVGRLRGPAIAREVEASVPADVVITHDGSLLFAYANDEATLIAARRAIEGALRQDGIAASVQISHWNDQLDRWRQTDPPVGVQVEQAYDAAEHDAETIETRTLVATAGKVIRAEFEQTMLKLAGELGLDCKIIEHPHLLTTQVGFTVTGPRRKIDEFAEGLRAEGQAYVRTETSVMMSPL